MVTEKTTDTKRKKPKFIRSTWHKMHKLGMKVKKKRKWRHAIGRHNKIRLKNRGRDTKPSTGWMAAKETRGTVKGFEPVTVNNLKELESVKKGQAVIIARVGKKKKMEIVKKANEMKLTILNRYRESKDATS
jgi:large subunit ribosomal protein L32e